jgi:hypothetical protein
MGFELFLHRQLDWLAKWKQSARLSEDVYQLWAFESWTTSVYLQSVPLFSIVSEPPK